MSQTSQSGRVVTLVAVSQGTVYSARAGDTTWTIPQNNTGETPALNYSGIVFSAANQQKLFFADGINYAYYDPNTDSVEAWTAATVDLQGNPITGELPVDSDGNTPRLICTWRGRTVLSGLIVDPQNWFMSAVDDPRNWDYSPTSTTPTQAIAGNNAPEGLIGDVVTALVPYSDDVMIFGGDHSIYQFSGDPMSGGKRDLISDAIGFAWGEAWCKDPYGNLYFVSNHMGVYSLVPGQQPQRISQAIEQLLVDVDTGANSIRMVWNDRFQGFHIYITLLANPAETTHFFYEQRSGAWWTDVYRNTDHNPLCCCTFDGNDPNDRVPLIGSWDGYVRAISATATDDDGHEIDSEVVIGPFLTSNMDDILLKDLQAMFAEFPVDVDFAILTGTTAEKALSSTPVVTGTFGQGRSFTIPIRRSGHAIWIRLSSSSAWAMESIRLRISTLGKVRMRGKGNT